MPHTPDLSIIIPAYQEAIIIQDSLEKLAGYLKDNPFGDVEVIVVVADSPDGTATLAKAKGSLFESFRVISAGSRVGKGRDVRIGMLEATGNYRVYMDADLATPLRHLEQVRALMISNEHIGIAVRNLFKVHHGISRKVLSSIANIAAQFLVIPGIKDTQCGFKVFSAEATEAVFTRQTMLKWSFDMELLAIGRQLGYKISTFDISDWHDPKEADMGLAGDSQINIIINGVLDPFKIRFNIWAGRYRKPSYTHISDSND